MYSKKQRHNHYKRVLKAHLKLKPTEKEVLCPMLGCWSYDMESKFPEFYLFRPMEYISYRAWFSDFNNEDYYTEEVKSHQRIILMFCIEMTR